MPSQHTICCVCEQCGKSFERLARRVRRDGARFCSRGCAARWYARPELRPGKFWARVVKRDGCWLWNGKHDGGGYGQVYIGDGHYTKTHIYAYEQLIGPVPEGKELDHLCHNPGCCNPAHLEPVTHRENVLRGNGWAGRHARKTHCPRGHEYETRIVDGRQRRFCRTCNNVSNRRSARAHYVPRPRVYVKPTHCPRGHEYNETNAHKNKKGTWVCRICDRARNETRRAKRLPLDLTTEAAG